MLRVAHQAKILMTFLKFVNMSRICCIFEASPIIQFISQTKIPHSDQ